MPIHRFAEARPEPRDAETLCPAQLAAGFRQDGGSLSSGQIPAQTRQGAQCRRSCPGHCRQHDVAPVSRHQQGALPASALSGRFGRCSHGRIPCRLYLAAGEAATAANAFREAAQPQAGTRLRRIGRDHQPGGGTHPLCAEHLPPTEIQNSRHGNHHAQQHRRIVQPVRAALQQLRQHDLLERIRLSREQRPGDRMRAEPGLRGSVPGVPWPCALQGVPLSGQGVGIRHREAESGCLQQGCAG